MEPNYNRKVQCSTRRPHALTIHRCPRPGAIEAGADVEDLRSTFRVLAGFGTANGTGSPDPCLRTNSADGYPTPS